MSCPIIITFLLVVCLFDGVFSVGSSNLRARSRSVFPSDKVRPHWCKLIQSNRTRLHLQSITRDSDSIYIMESDNVYRVPVSNLNTGENVLYMYNQENKTLFSSSKWYKDERFKISSAVIEKHQRDETGYAKRYDKNNAANKLKLFHFFVTSLDRSRVEQKPSSGNYGLLRSYVFYSEEEYLLLRNAKGKDEMIIDSVRDCSEKDKPSLCHKHSRFHAVTDGTSISTGFMFYFDRKKKEGDESTDQQASSSSRPPRVLMGPLKGQAGRGCLLTSEHREMINFPDRNSSNPSGTYLRIGGGDRTQMAFSVYSSAESQNENKNEDYFHHLPYGLIVNDTVYLFSKATRRVYYFKLDQIPANFFQSTSGSINTLASRHFNEFFICSPKQKILSSSQVSREPSQADYLDQAKKYVDPPIKETDNFTTLIIVIVILSSTVAGFIILVRLYYFRKGHNKRHIRKKPVVPDESTSPTSS